MSYQHPLLATDLSTGSDTVARFLPAVLDKDVRGIIAHVVAAPELPIDIPLAAVAGMAQSVRDVREETERRLVDWATAHGLPDWNAIVEYGPVGSTIARIGREQHADIIAVGSHGAGRIERVFLGSSARSVVRHAPCDTLVARGDSSRLEHILFATDLQGPSRLAARRARDLAARNGSRVTIMYALDPALFSGVLYPTPPEGRFDAAWLKEHVMGGLERMNKEFFGGVATEVIADGRAARAVVMQAENDRPDLIVVGSHGGGAIERFLLGSVAESIVMDAHCSVLVVRK